MGHGRKGERVIPLHAAMSLAEVIAIIERECALIEVRMFYSGHIAVTPHGWFRPLLGADI